MGKFLFDILNEYKSLYFISPHLDDAIFSCGALICELRKKANIKIINVFTGFDDKNYSKNGLIFLKKTSFENFSSLYKKRLKEDRRVFDKLKIITFNLGFKEFIFQRTSLTDYFNNKKIKKAIFEKIKSLTNDKICLFFSPYGLGNNPDHLLAREIIEKNFKNIIYYLEWPYIIRNYLEINKLTNHYQLFEFKNNLFIKEDLVKIYESQIKSIFQDKPILLLKERYLIKKNR